eukprot:scaffold4964_cov33-Tisochrysis_lutea.AAC.2
MLPPAALMLERRLGGYAAARALLAAPADAARAWLAVVTDGGVRRHAVRVRRASCGSSLRTSAPPRLSHPLHPDLPPTHVSLSSPEQSAPGAVAHRAYTEGGGDKRGSAMGVLSGTARRSVAGM